MKPAAGKADPDVLDAKLRELSRRLKRLKAKRPASAKALAADEDLQDIVARNLEVAIQNCMDIALHLCSAHGVVPETSAQAFAVLRPGLARVFRASWRQSRPKSSANLESRHRPRTALRQIRPNRR